MNKQLQIREIRSADCQTIVDAFLAQGWDSKPLSLYESYVAFQENGSRDILIAEWKGEFAGYLTIAWESGFIEFNNQGIPEVVDFNVLKKFQRKGIGNALMDEAERRMATKSSRAGIAFGVMKDYGAAQILYIKRGYIPWGNGLTVDGSSLEYGDEIVVSDDLIFHLSKELIIE